jgi:hypothetical protein
MPQNYKWGRFIESPQQFIKFDAIMLGEQFHMLFDNLF